MNAPSIVLFLAPGFEEIEALATLDVLRRNGQSVTTAAAGGATSLQVTGAHQITVLADCMASDIHPSDIVMTICPGGMPGAANLRDDTAVCRIIHDVHQRGGFSAAICAAPIVLKAAGVLDGRRYTCYPSFETQIGAQHYTAERVTTDGTVITACGPGASLEFAFALLRALGTDESRIRQLADGMKMK